MRYRWAVLLILLLAFGLRLYRVDHNIWWDEGFSYWLARQPAADLLDHTARDVHPPLYYLLLRGWWLVVGGGEFLMRFPSLLMGTLGAAAIYGLGRALGGRRAGLLAALFLAVSRFHIGWSQEIRMYMLATTLATGALWAALRVWHGGGRRAWLGYVLALAGALWALYLSVVVPLVINAVFVFVWLRQKRPRRLLWRWIGAQLAVGALFLPWALYTLPRIQTGGFTGAPEVQVSPLFSVQLNATMLSAGIATDIDRYLPHTLLVFGVLALGLAAVWRARRSPLQTSGLALLAAGLVFFALIAYIVSLPVHFFHLTVLAPRYYLLLSACFYALLGWGLSVVWQRRRWVAAAGALTVVGVALSGLAEMYPGRMRYDDYVSLGNMLEAYYHPGDAVVLYTDKDWPLFAAQYAGPWHGVPDVPMDEAFVQGRLGAVWEEAEAVWLVTTRYAAAFDPEGLLPAWLAARAAAQDTRIFGENALAFYARTPARAESRHELGPLADLPAGPHTELAPGVTLLGARLPLRAYPTGDAARPALYWDAPPAEAISLILDGPVSQTRRFDPPPPARSGPTRQQLDITLTPDLPPGAYWLLVQIEDGPAVEIGRLVLVSRDMGVVAAAEIQHPVEARLGKSIRLLGYDLAERAVAPGGVVHLTLYWQADEAIETRYKVFTHITGTAFNPAAGGFIWGQQDNEPVNNKAPTDLWAPGVVIADPYQIHLAPDAPPGTYTLSVGMYGVMDSVRLPVCGVGGAPLGDALELAEMTVQ